MPLSQVLDYIAEIHDIPVVLNETDLQDVGVTPDDEIRFNIDGLTLENALAIMLRNVNGARLDYLIQNDVLVITSADAAGDVMETRLYEMRHYQGLTPQIAIDLIQSMTYDDGNVVWMDIDGVGGEIEAIQGGLMIRQTQQVHREIRNLLAQLQRFSSAGLETPPEWQEVEPDRHGFGMGGYGPGGGYDGAMEDSGEEATPMGTGGGGGLGGGGGGGYF